MSDITAKLIGSNPPLDAGRDAIHVAVVPVVAAESLAPGQRVSLTSEGEGTGRGVTIGVVDPFLRERVKTGQRFWLFLPPGSITSLAHVWTHPAFADVSTAGEPAKPAEPSPDVAASKKWLEELAPQFEMNYGQLMSAAEAWLESGEYVCQYDSEDWRDTFYEHEDAFWKHYEVVTGKTITGDDRGSFFTCSC